MIGKDTSSGRGEDQYQMGDELYEHIRHYLKHKGIKLKDMCAEMGLPEYMIRKIMDRNIKMYCYRSILVRLAKHIGMYKDQEHFEKIQPRKVTY